MLANRVRMRLLDMGEKPEPKPEDIADENCKVATDDDFSGSDDGYFRYIGTATSLVIPHVIKGVEVTSYANMFSYSNVTEVRSNNPRVNSMTFMFYDCNSTSLDLSIFDTSNVTDMEYMFYDCLELTSLDVSGFNTSNVTSMYYMFAYCQSLTSLDLSNFDTSNVTNMYYMFRDCRELTSLDLSSFNTSNVTDMGYMFRECRSLTSLDLSSFNTSNVTNMSYMFYNARELTSLDLSSFNTSNVTNVGNMFRYCFSIITAYARTQADADKFNNSSNKQSNVNFVVK